MTYPTNQIPSTNPQNIAIATPIGLQSNPRDPTAQDNTFIPGTEWQNTVSKMFFKCVSTSFSGAVWTAFVPSSAGTVSTLDGNSGGKVGPDGTGNINVVGDSTTITIAGNPGTNTLTASLVGGGVASQSYVTNVSGPVVPTSAGVIDLNASTSTYTDGGTANTIKIELQGTNHALFVGRGVHSPATTIATGTSGQALVSAGAGSDPAFGTLGVSGGGTGDTSFTPYAVITGGTTSTNPLQSVASVGTAGQVLTSNGAGALPTFQSGSAVFLTITSVNSAASPYTVLTADEYIKVDCSGGPVTLNLPNGPATGRVIYIKDSTGSAATNNITVTTVGGAVNIDGSTSYVISTNYEAINLIFDGSAYEVF